MSTHLLQPNGLRWFNGPLVLWRQLRRRCVWCGDYVGVGTHYERLPNGAPSWSCLGHG